MIKKILKKIHKKYLCFKIWNSEIEKLKKQKYLIKKINLTKDQNESIDNLWKKNYGKKISKVYHRLYTAYDNKFNEKYFPEMYFRMILLEKFNPIPMKDYLTDKMLTQYLFGDFPEKKVKTVKNIIYNCNKNYYCQSGIITYHEAIKKLENIGEVIIKPTIDTNSGNNVRLINIQNGQDIISHENIEEILKKYKSNFTIQEKIKPHPTFSKLNPTSINTIRVNTYICDGKVYASPTTMRIGRYGKIVDNAHGGGLQLE